MAEGQTLRRQCRAGAVKLKMLKQPQLRGEGKVRDGMSWTKTSSSARRKGREACRPAIPAQKEQMCPHRAPGFGHVFLCPSHTKVPLMLPLTPAPWSQCPRTGLCGPLLLLANSPAVAAAAAAVQACQACQALAIRSHMLCAGEAMHCGIVHV